MCLGYKPWPLRQQACYLSPIFYSVVGGGYIYWNSDKIGIATNVTRFLKTAPEINGGAKHLIVKSCLEDRAEVIHNFSHFIHVATAQFEPRPSLFCRMSKSMATLNSTVLNNIAFCTYIRKYVYMCVCVCARIYIYKLSSCTAFAVPTCRCEPYGLLTKTSVQTGGAKHLER